MKDKKRDGCSRGRSFADWMDKAFGRMVVVGALVCYVFATLMRMVPELLGGLVLVLVVCLYRKMEWRLGRKDRAARLEDYKRRFEGMRMKKGKRRKNNKLKHYSPTLMPLGLNKLIRTGDSCR